MKGMTEEEFIKKYGKDVLIRLKFFNPAEVLKKLKLNTSVPYKTYKAKRAKK